MSESLDFSGYIKQIMACRLVYIVPGFPSMENSVRRGSVCHAFSGGLLADSY
jgi:hypothetical protein